MSEPWRADYAQWVKDGLADGLRRDTLMHQHGYAAGWTARDRTSWDDAAVERDRALATKALGIAADWQGDKKAAWRNAGLLVRDLATRLSAALNALPPPPKASDAK